MGKTFGHLESPISYEAQARSAFDRAFERRRGRSASRTFERPSTSRPWLVWLLIGAGVLALAAFSAWPGAGISRDASRTAVGSDAVWNGVIRQTGRAVPTHQSDQPAKDSPVRVAMASASTQRPPVKTVAMIEPGPVVVPAETRGQSAAKPAEPPSPTLGDPTVLSIQGLLKRAGYEPGPIDGLTGTKTRAAVMAWQLDQGLIVDGDPDAQVLQGLLDPVVVSQSANRLSFKSVSLHEREALESWCSNGRSRAEPLAYYRCLEDQIQALATGFRLPKPDTPGMSVQSVNFARASCTNALARGPQTYFQCVNARARLEPVQPEPGGVAPPAALNQPVATLN